MKTLYIELQNHRPFYANYCHKKYELLVLQVKALPC